jgi:2-hydroxycyclohexanecarboxyl-CoA dehydrogenase
MRGLGDKVAIVTGGGGGIGGAACRRFAEAGTIVAVLDVDQEAAERVAGGITAGGGNAISVACDITDHEAVAQAVAVVEARYGRTDILVNNAGWDRFLLFKDSTPADWQKLIAINLVGALNLHHAVLPGMIGRRFGRIVNIASDAARVGSSGEAVYAACKAGLLGFPRRWHANMPGIGSPSTWSARSSSVRTARSDKQTPRGRSRDRRSRC